LGILFLGFVIAVNCFSLVIVLIGKTIGITLILIVRTIEGLYGFGKILCGR
jgi:hypothetical protein